MANNQEKFHEIIIFFKKERLKKQKNSEMEHLF